MVATPTPTMVTEREQVVADLFHAAALVRLRGFAPGCYHDRATGAYDPVGALYEAIAPGFWGLGAQQVAMDAGRLNRAELAIAALEKHLGIDTLGRLRFDHRELTAWCQQPGRSTGEVATTMAMAAASAAL